METTTVDSSGDPRRSSNHRLFWTVLAVLVLVAVIVIAGRSGRDDSGATPAETSTMSHDVESAPQNSTEPNAHR